MITLRSTTLADVPLLTQLARQTMREAFGPPLNPAARVEQYVADAFTDARLTTELADPRAHFVLAEDATGRLVGYAKLRQGPPPRQIQDRRAVEIQRIYVVADCLGQGAGATLMRYCLDYVWALGARTAYLGVWERNERALAFYRRFGFGRVGWHYFRFGDERQRDYWLQKELTP